MLNQFDDADAAALCRQADRHAQRLARRLGLPAADAADFRQDLLLDLLQRAGGYDPARGRLEAFAEVVCRHRATRLAARQIRRVRFEVVADLRPDSHVDRLIPADTSLVCDFAGRAEDRRIAIGQVLERLDPPDRFLCDAISFWPVERLAACGFGSRATIYRRLRDLRLVFVALGLRPET